MLRCSVLLLAAAIAACDTPNDSVLLGSSGGEPAPGGASSPSPSRATGQTAVGPSAVKTCPTRGRDYVGFGHTDLVASRVEADIGADRARVKPISALRGEYPRAVGHGPTSTDSASAAFGDPPDRWFQEPVMSAVSVSASLRLAFETCLAVTADAPEYATTPAPTSASTICADLARKAWSKTATPDEVDACTKVALVDSAADPDSRRRWAYTCASVLSAAGFMTY